MILVETYIFSQDKLVKFKDHNSPFETDQHYLEGALLLTVNNIPVISPTEIDYVVGFWRLAVFAIKKHMLKKETDISLFASAVLKVIPEEGDRVSLLRNGRRVSTVNRLEFIGALVDEAEQFFDRADRLNPGLTEKFENEKTAISVIRNICFGKTNI
ncbi:hypothetical protein ACES2L_00685 [Bdellovibrio bacteriovorus]